MIKLNNEEVIQVLFNRLEEYLDYLGLEKTGSHYNCIAHPDGNASMSIVPSNRGILKCFGCNETFTIFDVCHIMEGYPKDGEGFFLETIPHLCEILKVPYNKEEITPEKRQRILTYKAYEDTSNLITYTDAPSFDSYLKIRNISKAVANYYRIGAISSFKEYKEKIIKLGYEEKFLQSIGLLNTKIFNENNLIFTINNDKGRPVAFVARRMDYTENSGFSKYYNSENSEIYTKGNTLYNFDIAHKTTPPLYIVEGYIDCIQLCQSGITNVVALGSTAFTDDSRMSHVQLLQKYAIKDLVLCFDQDEAGRKNLRKTVDILVQYPEFNVTILELPSEHGEKVDCDSYLQTHTRDEFLALKKKSLFEYRLDSYPYDANNEQIAKEMIPVICMSNNRISHYTMAKALNKRTGIPIEVIQKQIDAHFNEQDFKAVQELSRTKKEISKSIDRCANLDELKNVLNNNLENIHIVNQVSENDVSIYKQRVLEFKQSLKENTRRTFRLGKFKILDRALEGIPIGPCYVAIAAVPNVGKSTFVRNLTYEMLLSNPDLMVLMFSIDDSFEKVVPSYIAMDSQLNISQVRKPYETIKNDREKLNRLNIAWKNFESLSDRLIIKDLKDNVGTLAEIERNVKAYKEKYPDKNLLAVIDNFHNLHDFANQDTRIKFMNLSDMIKGLTVTYSMPIVNIMELRKQERAEAKPNLQDIKETNDIMYDADIIMLIHQELNNIREKSNLYWKSKNDGKDFFGEDIKFPINELIIAKTKESGFKGSLFFRFRSDKATFHEMRASEARDGDPNVYYND